jgi:monoamine oxidase
MKVIIIGAGAAGLMAAKHLAAAGHQVQVLEARDRLGGRIYSFRNDADGFVCEAGAEFIHGNLPVTIDLLNEAGIAYTMVQGKILQHFDGQWQQGGNEFDHAALVEKKLSSLKEDISMKEFVEREFNGDEYMDVRHSLLGYIEGYYAADPAKTSAMHFYKEWKSEDEQQYRVDGGYSSMINYLAECITKGGGNIQTSTVVKEVHWQPNQITVKDDAGSTYTADKVIIAIPLGVWQHDDAIASITFHPALAAKVNAAKQLGFGSVIKILLQFKAFWQNIEASNTDLKQMGFIFSDKTIPTYWSQLPAKQPLLTGWLAGPKAQQVRFEDDAAVITETIASLSSIFNIPQEELQQMLLWSKVYNWNKDPFTLGAYTYSTINCDDIKKSLATPVADTLFFAGEALYTGTETGTVEAALTSGMFVAREIEAAMKVNM